MVFQPNQCSVFIQIWVDTNAVQMGSTSGVYLVDNGGNNGSTNEGTPSLSSNVTTSSTICWTINNIDPNSTDTLSIQNFGNCTAWGFNGTPQAIPGTNETVWTGQAETNGGPWNYEIMMIVNGSPITTINVFPSIAV